jgi:hypothetical protein
MYAKSGELSKAAQECLILANIFTSRGDSENSNRNFNLAYQYDPQLHQSPIYEAVTATPDESQVPAAKPDAVSTPQPAVAPKNLEDLLQEADFYLDLGFLSEAKASMDQYRQAGTLDAEFQKRVDRYDSLLKSQGGQSPAPTPEAEPTASTSVVDTSEEIDLSGFESTSHAPVEETAGSAEATQVEGFETTAVVEPAPPSLPKSSASTPPFRVL